MQLKDSTARRGRSTTQLKALLVLAVTILSVDAKENEDARLKRVERVIVTGNSRSANEVRKTLNDLHANTRWKKTCISSVTNKDEADAVLEIVESVPLGGSGGEVALRLPQSAATLTLKSGDVIWSDDSQYSSVFILKRLNEAVCRTRGLKGKNE